ncbi:hypothetical protein DL766_003698 [Monosporascus sp. MC13-8B]|uniref:Uncharacterized protein n=1 Tax=Monosporascus cannonballus TaxID=155416 RepID=A0ABY0GZ62_9PEZI|nr:hypothetical protein DL762_007604 [Monosporascus cannonballus]RYO82137.1 hypothetical protein DL763_008333 [Monosporascus cannonballus]RYP32974.1 hypothetical protein DL766_003698 [Monosporascus sp. MC13-8B]
MQFFVTFLTTLSCVYALVISPLHRLAADVDASTPKSHGIGGPVYHIRGEAVRHERRNDTNVYGHDALPSRDHIAEQTDAAQLKANHPATDSLRSQGIARDEIDDAISRYNADHPTNQTTHLVYCFYPLNIPVASMVAFQRDYYPHIVIFSDTERHTYVRRPNLGQVRGAPFMFPLQMDGHLFHGGSAPGSDRVMFDEEGVYLGALMFRGEPPILNSIITFDTIKMADQDSTNPDVMPGQSDKGQEQAVPLMKPSESQKTSNDESANDGESGGEPDTPDTAPAKRLPTHYRGMPRNWDKNRQCSSKDKHVVEI